MRRGLPRGAAALRAHRDRRRIDRRDADGAPRPRTALSVSALGPSSEPAWHRRRIAKRISRGALGYSRVLSRRPPVQAGGHPASRRAHSGGRIGHGHRFQAGRIRQGVRLEDLQRPLAHPVPHSGTRPQQRQGVSPRDHGRATGAAGLAPVHDRARRRAGVHGHRDSHPAVSAARGEIEIRFFAHSHRRTRHARRLVRTPVRPETPAGVRHARGGAVRDWRPGRSPGGARHSHYGRGGVSLGLDRHSDLSPPRVGLLRHGTARRAGRRAARRAARAAPAHRRTASGRQPPIHRATPDRARSIALSSSSRTRSRGRAGTSPAHSSSAPRAHSRRTA